MDSKFNPEDTQFFSNEASTAASSQAPSSTEVNSSNNEEPQKAEAKKADAKKTSKWGVIADGVAAGLVIGAVAATGISAKAQDNNVEETEDGEESPTNHSEVLSNPDLVDGDISVATSVSDDMSFAEAFAAARAEVGAGGVFEWHGTLYGTYTQSEWAHMTPQERADYQDHFNWNHIDTTTDPNAHHYALNDPQPQPEPQPEPDPEPSPVPEPGPEPEPEPNVEIIGIYTDDETGYTYGHMTIDEVNTLVVDIDGDQTFDVMIADTNMNGEFDENDYMDNIQDVQMTVSDLQQAYIAQQENETNDPGELYQTEYNTDANNEEPPMQEVMNETEIYAQNDTMSDFINDADAGTYMA